MTGTVITLSILPVSVVLSVREALLLAVTATLVRTSLVASTSVTPEQAFAGFLDHKVIPLCAMCMVGGALFETGMANRIGGPVSHFAKTSGSFWPA